MAHKISFLAVLVVAVLFSSQGMATATIGSQGQKTNRQKQRTNRTDQELKAIAFLLGWDSKLVLVQKRISVRHKYLSNIRSEIHQLGVSLAHPVEYYFRYPITDEGDRAQAFAEETMALLENVNPDIANHFGVAHNLLLSIRHADIPEAARRAELAELVQFLDVPDALKQPPEEGLLTWVDTLHAYFVLTARRHVKARL